MFWEMFCCLLKAFNSSRIDRRLVHLYKFEIVDKHCYLRTTNGRPYIYTHKTANL